MTIMKLSKVLLRLSWREIRAVIAWDGVEGGGKGEGREVKKEYVGLRTFSYILRCNKRQF